MTFTEEGSLEKAIEAIEKTAEGIARGEGADMAAAAEAIAAYTKELNALPVEMRVQKKEELHRLQVALGRLEQALFDAKERVGAALGNMSQQKKAHVAYRTNMHEE